MIQTFQINPWGFTGAFAVLMAWSLAAFLLKSATRDRVTILFAIVLIVEGLVLVTSSSGVWMLFDLKAPDRFWWEHHAADCAMLVVYPIFLAHVLPQKFLRHLRKPAAVFVLLVIAVVALLAPLFTDFWLMAALLAIMFMAAFGLAIHAVLISKTELARRRAKLFAFAFGLRDVTWGIVYASGVFWLWRDSAPERLVLSQVYAGSTLLYIPIVAYGILSVRLLNIRFELRKGVKRGTLAAAFVAIFFLISEGSASILSDQFGSVAGLLGATLIVFLVSPLHRVAEWFSGQVVTVDEGAEYKAYRKLQMYAAAVEDSLSFGEVGPAQQQLLERLRESLGVSPQDARRIEADLGAISAG